MQLSIEERLIAYKTALEAVEGRRDRGNTTIHFGVCEELCYAVTGGYTPPAWGVGIDEFTKETFPEFYAHKTEYYGYFWWPMDDFNTRIDVLQACINELS